MSGVVRVFALRGATAVALRERHAAQGASTAVSCWPAKVF